MRNEKALMAALLGVPEEAIVEVKPLKLSVKITERDPKTQSSFTYFRTVELS